MGARLSLLFTAHDPARMCKIDDILTKRPQQANRDKMWSKMKDKYPDFFRNESTDAAGGAAAASAAASPAVQPAAPKPAAGSQPLTVCADSSGELFSSELVLASAASTEGYNDVPPIGRSRSIDILVHSLAQRLPAAQVTVVKRLDKHNMGPAQVLEWLDNLPKLKDRASYAHRFRQLGVEGEDLITFDQAMLQQEIGVHDNQDCKIILKGIKALKKSFH